ncbi:ATPase [Rubellimicrobium rubrum]|uniref:ATPase n=1 Tax=Rubellimicrobium rubrum TaxID=2585369 RepID=A0A5C4N0B3_9RHOB|nr:ATPase [Rubellimicrobium rubrum]TNC51197.1 ATPase [Rubellimicrobium rubrum]
MIYRTDQEWLNATERQVLLFGMSGLGKTHLAKCLRGTGRWFHYSVDYRIGTRYMGELIADNAKREAMKVPFLRELLMSDSIYIGSNITFDNLDPVSTYLGKPGDPGRGGLPFEEYQRRQSEFREAEVAALHDTGRFIDRAKALYGYRNFVCDTGGSICEWVDPTNPEDPILRALSARCLMIWIKGSDDHTTELVRRFDQSPKPMAYRPDFLLRMWTEYQGTNDLTDGDVDPDAFIRFTYAQALAHRQPLYASMAQHWGVTVQAKDMAHVDGEAAFVDVVAAALRERMRQVA